MVDAFRALTVVILIFALLAWLGFVVNFQVQSYHRANKGIVQEGIYTSASSTQKMWLPKGESLEEHPTSTILKVKCYDPINNVFWHRIVWGEGKYLYDKGTRRLY